MKKHNVKLIKSTARYNHYLCPKHDDHNPSLVLDKQGRFAGWFRCWGCGWHGKAEELGVSISTYKVQKKQKKVDWNELYSMATCLNYFAKVFYKELYKKWNVAEETLQQLEHGWLGNTHIFAMRNEHNQIIGLQRQTLNGRKFCWEGSWLGLFIPKTVRQDIMLITEGCSDLATALDMGFNAIGRPNCNTCTRRIQQWLKNWWTGSKILIISDNGNDAEREGARKLQKLLKKDWECYVLVPLAKDLRAWVQKDGKQEVGNCLGELK